MNRRCMAVKEKIFRAFKCLLKHDRYLLDVKINERSLTHQLAVYLEQEFPEYNVDCEYNRDGHDSKKLLSFKIKKNITPDDTEGTTVYPDIIIHHRGTKDNFVVIEAKKTLNQNQDKNDKQKLKAYKQELNYLHAFFIRFPVGDELNNYSETSTNSFIEEIQL